MSDKKSMDNPSARRVRKLKKNAKIIDVALDEGLVTRRKINEHTGIPLHEITQTFEYDKELFEKYGRRRRELASLAADNIFEIVSQPKHPQNFAASKFILTNFKNEFEDVLDPAKSREDGVELSINGTGVSNANPINISFGKKKPVEAEEEAQEDGE